ncbi:hypothetical protein [Aureispira sp. CCB-E]|uniref:hypothetical protein n=1 Tax=Aureispira sp. CCB-E TaxID=3051121 RepID=UPI00286913F2|nr:hypothetical protein [Aureispira sp. CCB-E]WMX16530.1 hypothetical protein QP953_09140 [Aureispira sp. CCB-E]
MNPILTELLEESKKYIVLYEKQNNDENLAAQITPAQKAYYKNIKVLIPQLEALEKEKAPYSGAVEFNEMYNKYFAYLDKFTSVQQSNVSAVLQSKRLLDRLQKLYGMISSETIERQVQVLGQRKKSMDKWSNKLSEQLQSEEMKVSLEKRFEELLQIANEAIGKQGKDTISLNL